MTTTVSVKMDEDIKASVCSMLEGMGMTFGGFVNMAARQLLIQGRLPFEVIAPTVRDIPSEETRRALVGAEAKMLGIVPDDAVSFADGHEAAAFIRGL